MNAALQWEINWVMENADRYGCPQHAKAVCGNITKRYFADKAKKLLAEQMRDPDIENMNALLAHFDFEQIPLEPPAPPAPPAVRKVRWCW